MQSIDREELRSMMHEQDVTVVEVLGENAYKEFHIPGAINVPLDEDFDSQIGAAVPDKHEPVAVYCMDSDCDASPKAAARMEELGYEKVFDYEAGKQDWKQAGLPIEG